MEPTVKDAVQAKSRLNVNGRVVIPAEIRQKMGLNPGDSVLMELEDGVLRIESYRARIRRIQQSLAQLIPPGRCLTDEFIADRREEARREMEEFERDQAQQRQALQDSDIVKDGTRG